MQGGAVSLARQAARMVAEMDEQPDLILTSDMLNMPVFLTLAGPWAADTPVALYFHENQLTYPLQGGEKRDLHYGFINFVSALGADRIFFNSAYHLEAFLDELPRLLKHFPDYNELGTPREIQAKAEVLPLGLDLARLDAHRSKRPTTGRPLILWNHRWEYDKDPESFFQAVYALEAEGIDFGLVLLGESFRNRPDEFLLARQRLPDRIIHFGYAEDASAYAQLL
jgi:glycosyltransferase involved in cell wall biosynthesis